MVQVQVSRPPLFFPIHLRIMRVVCFKAWQSAQTRCSWRPNVACSCSSCSCSQCQWEYSRPGCLGDAVAVVVRYTDHLTCLISCSSLMKTGQKVQQDDTVHFNLKFIKFIQQCTLKLRTGYTCNSETDIKTSKVQCTNSLLSSVCQRAISGVEG